MLKGKTIVLGVSGGIAAYKAADLASKLTQAGASVRVILTEHARKFVAPLTFEAVTANPVIADMFEAGAEHRINHVALAELADALVIAPATANILAKLACGLADDMLSTTVLAMRRPVILVPAMHTQMWENPVTRENVARLTARGFHLVAPAVGRLASGGYGAGRYPENEVILGQIQRVLGLNGDLAGKLLVVTAGGTQEPIDPVRILTNRSSGKMGCAIAEAARDRGATVTLIHTPSLTVAPPAGVDGQRVETALQMKSAVERACQRADALIMAAAVADFQVATVAAQKIKKRGDRFRLDLVPTPDILAAANGRFLKIGFAAESQNLVKNARLKIAEKKLDLIVANNIADDQIFGADTNKVTIIAANGSAENLPLMTKREVADKILDRVVSLLASGETASQPRGK
jgi:phosphopantothenoylcysteine decarboxylase/phosphopantothenate--cysteine ligase